MQDFSVFDTQMLVNMLQTSPRWTEETERIASVLYTRMDKRFVDNEVKVLKLKYKMGWFKAYRILALIFACLGCFGLLMNLIMLPFYHTLGNFSSFYEIYGNYGAMGEYMSISVIYGIVAGIITSIILFLTYWGLGKFKKIGLYAVYAYSVLLMFNIAITFWVIPNYFSVMRTMPEMTTQAINIAMYVTYLMYGFINAVYIALGVMNIVYFYKRRNLFN